MALPKITPELGEVIELMYPESAARELAARIGASHEQVRWYVKTHNLRKGARWKPVGYTAQYPGRHLIVKMNDEYPLPRRFAFAHVVAWEKKHGRTLPTNHVVVNLDGNYANVHPENLYCMPRSELLSWARFCRFPVEVHVGKLCRKIMTLNTSEKVKQKLLDVLDQVIDPAQTPDLLRQRAVCETVQTLVNLLRVEVAYVALLEGDGVIPFLEGARQEAVKQRAAGRKRRGLLAGPAADHPWRGLGASDRS